MLVIMIFPYDSTKDFTPVVTCTALVFHDRNISYYHYNPLL